MNVEWLQVREFSLTLAVNIRHRSSFNFLPVADGEKDITLWRGE